MRSSTVFLLVITLASLLRVGLWPPMSQGATAQFASNLDSQAAPTANKILTLRQGMNGYAGVRDTWISSAEWDTPPQRTVNYGQNETLVLGRR